MSEEVRSWLPQGASALTPYICPRECARAIDWYVDVFAAQESGERFTEPGGTVGHASINIDGVEIMLSDAHPDYGAVAPEVGNTTATYALNVYVPDVDSTMTAAEEAGATIQRPAEDQFYGSRLATMVDPFGVRWMVSTHVRDVSAEEMSKAAGEYSGPEPGTVQ